MIGQRQIVPPVFLAGVGWLAGLRLRARGRPARGKVLLVANHVSWLDILALAGSARATFVAKDSLAGHGFLKWLCEQNDTIFIARDQRGTVGEQVEQVRTALAARRLVVFPEGTTGNGRQLDPFKSSLLSAAERIEAGDAALSIQPVALDYRQAAQIAWFGEEGGLHNVLRVLGRLRSTDLTVHYLRPLRGEELRDRKTMAKAAQEAIAAALRL